MKHQGYLIARNRGADQFFTSSSAYDRPQWKPAESATRYLDIQLAESALKKLLVNGAYEARIIPMAEAMSFEMPNDDETVTLPSDEERQDLEASGGHPDDLSTEPPEGAEHIVDADGDDDEDRENDELTAAVDKKLDAKRNGDVGDLDSELPSEEQMPGDEDQIDQQGADLEAALNADASNQDQETSPGPEDELRDEPVVQPTIKEAKENDDGRAGPMDHEEKVKVPAEVMSDLRKVIAEFSKTAQFANSRDDAKATFALTVVAALQELEELLAVGTVESIKRAQIKMTSLMNPITTNIPPSVIKFIAMGGRKPTLRDLFDSIRSEKKTNK